MAVFSAFGGPKRFFVRTAQLAAIGMVVTIAMVWLAQLYGTWYGDGRVLGPGEGFWSYAYAWGTVLIGLYGLWAFNYRRVVRPLGIALVGYGVMGFLGMLGMRFGLPGFLIYWAGAGAAATYTEPFFRGHTRPARMPDRLISEIRSRAAWVRETMVLAHQELPPHAQDFVARALMAQTLRPIWKEVTLRAPAADALQDLRELPLLAKELVGEVRTPQDEAVYRAVFKALLADWNAIHAG